LEKANSDTQATKSNYRSSTHFVSGRKLLFLRDRNPFECRKT